VSTAAQIAIWFDGLADVDVGPAVMTGGLYLEGQIKAAAPMVTGRYRRSWSTERTGPAEVTVGSDAPYGRRLEYGFVGVDSLGRHYNQGPRPHVVPAVMASEARVVEIIAAALDRTIR
jgi:hypothetical protein